MSATLYIRCDGGDYFRAKPECPYDGWSSRETAELADVATAFEKSGRPLSIDAMREHGVSEAALRLSVVIEFGDDAARFDELMPQWLIRGGEWFASARDDFRSAAGPVAGLLMDVEGMLRERAANKDVTILRRQLPGVPRLELQRALRGGAMRYLELHAVDDPASLWRFTFLFGEYGGSDNTDGRRGGDLAYVRAFIEAWLVDLRPASDLPAPVDPTR